MITSGEGRVKVWLKTIEIGKDIVYLLGGGEQAHIGGVVICEPGKPTNSIRFEGHYDYVILEMIAETLCRKYNRTIVLLGGIHIDDATKDEINMIIENCRRIQACI
jgi:gallate decarboxylase subunit D